MKKLLIFCYISTLTFSCKKYLSLDSPTTVLTSEAIFRSDATATAAVLSIYAGMETDGLAYNHALMTGLSSDEMINYSTSPSNIDFATNNLTAENPMILNSWRNWYKYIYQANAILDGLRTAGNISSSVAKQLEGEARFIRAFCYFYLVNLFGDVPVVQSTDYRRNSEEPRTSSSEVNSFITNELQQAILLLSEDYLNGNNTRGLERVRANKWVAKALLAKQYLYRGQWEMAELTATEILNNTSTYELLPDLEKVFLKNSREAILQWQSQVPGYNSYPGAFFILTTTPNSVALDTMFVKSFHPNDYRKSNWINSIENGGHTYFFPFKYKIKQNATAISEYTMVMRVSEQYLIRAEARARQEKLFDAESDLNAIRQRANLSIVNGLNKFEMLDSIEQQRRWEFFAEFGDRWLNLKRVGKASFVLSDFKGSNWSPEDTLYPIPAAERLLNNQLSQNPGY